jgi:hypothetical protein
MELGIVNLFYCPHCGRRTWGRVDVDGELPDGHDWQLFSTFVMMLDSMNVLPDDDQPS